MDKRIRFMTNELKLKNYTLKLTCTVCPEQYDVFKDNNLVAYLRLRHGNFTVDAPDINGIEIYHVCPNGDGEFEDNERMKYLTIAINKIDKYYKSFNKKYYIKDMDTDIKFSLKYSDDYDGYILSNNKEWMYIGTALDLNNKNIDQYSNKEYLKFTEKCLTDKSFTLLNIKNENKILKNIASFIISGTRKYES
jgi:hypothetical protein